MDLGTGPDDKPIYAVMRGFAGFSGVSGYSAAIPDRIGLSKL